LSAESNAGPLWLLAELTYRCPLHCVFCSNPLDYVQHRDELGTDDWLRVLHEARALGAVQLGFSGGEPLLRDDLEVLVQEAHRLGYYTNLITSGIGLTEARAAALKAAGLDHIQLSFQDSTRELNDFLSSTRTFDLKAKVAATIKRHGYPMVLNCVLHRYNLPHVGRIVEMAEAMGADVLELANTQYYGWAWLNRAALMPDREALAAAEREVERHRAGWAAASRSSGSRPTTRMPGPRRAWRAGARCSWWSHPTAWPCLATARACCRAWGCRTSARRASRRSGRRAPPSTAFAARHG
jgi:pyrroloquinoline quinone biosynthesis protein E